MEKFALLPAVALLAMPTQSWGGSMDDVEDVLYECTGNKSAGYISRGGANWKPVKFRNSHHFRIVKSEGLDEKLLIQDKRKKGEDWGWFDTFKPKETLEDNGWVNIRMSGGELFSFNSHTNKFSYTITGGYLNNQTSTTPYLVVGSCREPF